MSEFSNYRVNTKVPGKKPVEPGGLPRMALAPLLAPRKRCSFSAVSKMCLPLGNEQQKCGIFLVHFKAHLWECLRPFSSHWRRGGTVLFFPFLMAKTRSSTPTFLELELGRLFSNSIGSFEFLPLTTDSSPAASSYHGCHDSQPGTKRWS